MAYHFNAGWQNKDLILTNYSDVSDIGYHLYDMHADGSFRHYYKFKYVSTDEDFQKLYMDSDDDENPELVFDYSIFELGMFEHTYDDQVEEISNRWYITDDYLNDETFKQSLSDSFYMHADVEQMRLNFLYLTVENNIVTQIEFGYWGGYDDQQSYYYTIVIERDNYTFDIGALSAGFIYYEDNMD